MAFPIRRATPQRPPLKQGRSRVLQPPTTVVVAGVRPVITRGPQKSVARRPGNDLNSGVGSLTVVRGGAQWIQAPAYNSGGLVPRRTQGVRRAASPRGLADLNSGLGPVAVLRGGTQWIQAQYSSGGLAPSLVKGVSRKAALRRGLSDLQLAASYNSGGLVPRRTQAVRRAPLPPTRALASLNAGLGPVSAVRGDAQWVQAAAAVVVPDGDLPSTFSVPRSLPPLRLGRSRLQTATPAASVAGQRPTITRAAQKSVARRAGNDLNSGVSALSVVRGGAQWIQAPQYNSGGLVPRRTQGVRRLAAPRGLGDANSGLGPVAALRSQWVQAQYTSGGLTPSLVRSASRRAPVRRSQPDLLAPAYNSGGLVPEQVIALRRSAPLSTRLRSRLVTAVVGPSRALISQGARRKPIAPQLSRFLVAAPTPITPGVASGVTAEQKPAWPRPTRATSRIVLAKPSAPLALAAVVTRAIQKLAVRRALVDANSGLGPVAVARGGPQWLQAPAYNSGGLTPLRARSVQKARPFRSASIFITAAAQPVQSFNSASFVTGQQLPLWPRPTRSHSRPVVPALPSAVPALRPALTRGLRRTPIKRGPSHSIQATPSAIVGDSPTVSLAFRQAPPTTRLISRRQVPPTFAPGPGSAPYFTRATQKPKPQRVRANSQWLLAPAYNSGGLLPLRSQGVRRRPAKVAAARLLPAALYNSGGLLPLRVQALRRPAAKVRPSQSIQPAYNSGGLTPQRLQGIRRLPIKAHASQFLEAPPYNAGGLIPLRSQATQKPTPKRSRSRLVVPPTLTPSVGAQPFVLRVQQKPSLLPRVGRPRFLTPPATVQVAGLGPQLIRALRRKGIPRSSSRLITPPPLFVVPVPLRTRGVLRKGIPRTPSHWVPPPFFSSGGLTPTRMRGLPRKGIPRTPSRWAPALPYNSGGVTSSTVRGVCRKPSPVKPSRLVRSAPYNSGGLKPLFRAAPRQKPPTRPHSYLPLTGVINLGLSRDITLALGLPGSRWQMRMGASRWQLGAPGERWKVGSSLSRWVVGIPDDRWKDKPPGT